MKWVSIARLVACFPQASKLLPAASACVCARQSYLRKQNWRAAPRAWPLILQSKPSITFWNSLRRDCQMTCRGSNLDSNLNCASWPTSCNGFPKSQHKLCGVWILFRSITDAEFEPREVTFLALMPCTTWTCLFIQFKDFLSNLPLKMIFCCVTDHWPTIYNSISKICPKFQVLCSHFSEVNELIDKHWARTVQKEIFNSNLFPML